MSHFWGTPFAYTVKSSLPALAAFLGTALECGGGGSDMVVMVIVMMMMMLLMLLLVVVLLVVVLIGC